MKPVSISDISNLTEKNYEKLQNIIVPMFYHKPQVFESLMRSTIAINGSYYNAQRMMMQYVEHAYMSAR